MMIYLQHIWMVVAIMMIYLQHTRMVAAIMMIYMQHTRMDVAIMMNIQPAAMITRLNWKSPKSQL